MADLTKSLKVEEMSRETWEADKSARQCRVASRRPSNNPEKSLFRQMAWANRHTDTLGDLIRMVNELNVTDTPDVQGGAKYFNAANKDSLIQKLRAATITNDNNVAYLREISFKFSSEQVHTAYTCHYIPQG